jgi:metal-responsive CopG/Arc/MetJ family transcriptional regulator
MRTTIVLNDELVDEVFKFSQAIFPKKELIETALKEYVNTRKRKDIKELKEKFKFQENYNYMAMRK